MFKKLYLIFLFFLLFPFNTALSKEKNDKNLLAFSGGIWDWNDNTTPYPIAMEYVNDLIQRVTQQESLYSLQTMENE